MGTRDKNVVMVMTLQSPVVGTQYIKLQVFTSFTFTYKEKYNNSKAITTRSN